MPVRVLFKPGSDAAARLIGLPITAGVVNEPAGWSERELTSHIVRYAGPYLHSIETVKMNMGGCRCLGRRQ